MIFIAIVYLGFTSESPWKVKRNHPTKLVKNGVNNYIIRLQAYYFKGLQFKMTAGEPQPVIFFDGLDETTTFYNLSDYIPIIWY